MKVLDKEQCSSMLQTKNNAAVGALLFVFQYIVCVQSQLCDLRKTDGTAEVIVKGKCNFIFLYRQI